MPGESFVINIITTGDKEAVASQGRVAAASRDMGAAAKGASTAQASAAATTAQKWTSAGNSAVAAGKKLNRGVTLPVLAITAVTGKMAIDFEKSMRNVNSIAQLPERQFERINQQVLSMAGRVAQAPITLSEGLYDLVSSGFKAGEAITVLESSARAATAGLTTTEVSTKAVAAALNAYHRPASDAKAISDDLFQTVNLGVVTFDELASVIGYVLPAAATMGIDLKQVGASISTLTKEGQSGSNAVTNMNAAITSFIKPTKDMKSLLKELGYETSTQLIHQKGFQGAIELVTRAVHGNKEEIGKLFPNVRAMRAVFGLTGKSAKSASEDLQGFQHDTGATTKVLHEQQKSLAYQWNQLKAEGSALAIELGKKLIPTFRDLAHEGAQIVTWFTNLPEGVQSTTIKVALFGAALGPILTIGGNLLRVIGGIAKGMKVIAGLNIVGELGAALSLARAGEMGGITMLGKDLAGSLVGGLKIALPIAVAGAGLVNIISSATKGDWHDAGFKAGGALVGGIVGFLAGGSAGAALGAGAGSFIGGFIGNLFDDGDQQNAFKKRTEETIRSAIRGHNALIRSSHQVELAERRLHRTGEAQRQINRELKATQDRLNAARKDGDTARVRHEEARLNELKAKQIRLTHAQWHEETLLHAAHVKSVDDARRARNVEVALVRTRQAQLEQSQKRERQARKEFEAAVLQQKPLKEQNEKERDLIDAQKRRKGASEKLHAAEKELGGTMKEIADKFGEKFADKLRKQLPLWRQTASQVKASKEAMRDLTPAIEPLSDVIKKFGERGQRATHKVQQGTEKLGQKAPGQLKKVGEGYTDLSETGTEGLGVLGTNTNSFLKSLNTQPLEFTVTQPTKVRGQNRGGLTTVPGKGRKDSVPMAVNGVLSAMVAPGETLVTFNRHQRPLVERALTNEYGVGGLGGFFQHYDRAHEFAKGGEVKGTGSHIREPQIAGRDPLRSGDQAIMRVATKAANAYIEKHMGPKPGLGTFDGNPVSEWIIPILQWARSHGWGGSVSSGYRTPSQQIAAATGYGLQHYGPAGPLGSNHVKINYPGGAVDVTDPAQLAAILRGYPGKPNLVWGGPVMGDFVHFSATGHQRGGILRLLNKGGSYTASDVKHTGQLTPFEAGIAMLLGGFPASTRYLSEGLGTIKGENNFTLPNNAQGPGGHIGLWSESPTFGSAAERENPVTASKLARKQWSADGKSFYPAWGRWQAEQSGQDGAKAYGPEMVDTAEKLIKANVSGGAGGASAENVPAIFHGARTGSLHFPSIPKTLHGVNKEIGKWEGELRLYRTAAKAAKAKPKIAQALQQNVTAIEGHLKQLRNARALLRRKAAMKKITKKLQGKLGRITGAEREMEEAERVFVIADQTAGQVVGLEPQQPELAADATQEAREAAEKRYVEAFKAYVEQQERPAYNTVLDALAAWRNVTLGGEQKASHLQTEWEKDVRTVDHEIDAVNAFTEKVAGDKADWKKKHPKDDFPKWIKEEIKKDHANRARLPVLRFRDRETRKVLGEAREAFYGGRKSPLDPPAVPMAGSGSIEDVLANIQGTHWPDQHGKLPASALGPPRVAGKFGGEIWTAQEAIEELGLKVNQVAGSIGGGGGGPSEAENERLELLEAENAQLKRDRLVALAQAPVLSNYLGAYEQGGILPETGYYLGHKGEKVTPADQVGNDGGVILLEPHINLHGGLGALEGMIEARIELREQGTGRKVGVARATPSAPGRKAAFHQGKRP